jgi:hypothetical protein
MIKDLVFQNEPEKFKFNICNLHVYPQLTFMLLLGFKPSYLT